MRQKIIEQEAYWEEMFEPFFQGLMTDEQLRFHQKYCAAQIVSVIKLAANKTDLKLELIDFLMANNWLNLENKENAEGVVDCYLDAFKGIDSDEND